MPVIYLYTGVLGTLSLLSSFFDTDGRVQQWFARTWSRLILKTVSIRVQIEGMEHVSAGKPAIYAANHLSAVDVPVLYAGLRTISHHGQARALPVPVSGMAFEALRTNSGGVWRPARFAALALIAPVTLCAAACL